MGDALFDAEVVVLGAFEPRFEFGDGEYAADEEDQDGPLAASTGGSRVVGFGFGWTVYVSLFLHIYCGLWFRPRDVRNASNVFRPPCSPDFSPNAPSSRSCDAKPFMTNLYRKGWIKSIDQGMNENRREGKMNGRQLGRGVGVRVGMNGRGRTMEAEQLRA